MGLEEKKKETSIPQLRKQESVVTSAPHFLNNKQRKGPRQKNKQTKTGPPPLQGGSASPRDDASARVSGERGVDSATSATTAAVSAGHGGGKRDDNDDDDGTEGGDLDPDY